MNTKRAIKVAAISCVVLMGIIVGVKQNQNGVSELMKANVEALAGGESSYSCSATANCYSKTVYNNKTHEWENIPSGSISCTGTSSCESGDGWVCCDGNESKCK